MNANAMLKAIEMNGGKITKYRYSKWISRTGPISTRIQDNVTLCIIDFLGGISFMVIRDSSNKAVFQGEGNGMQWIKENNYISRELWLDENDLNHDRGEE